MQYYEFPNAIITEFSGRDCERYLNARLTNNIKNLAIGQLVQAAALTPQGRTEFFGTILRLEKERFLVIADGGEQITLLTALRRYIVADRVDTKDLSNVYSLIHIDSYDTSSLELALPTNQKSFTSADNGTIIWQANRLSKTSGIDLICPADLTQTITSGLSSVGQALTHDSFTALRIFNQYPTYPEELNLDHLLSEAQVSHAISFTKGCYVGQEVIEKIDSHGKAPRVLRALFSEKPLEVTIGETVMRSDGENSKSVGEVASSIIDTTSNRTLLFAYLKNIADLETATLLINSEPVKLISST